MHRPLNLLIQTAIAFLISCNPDSGTGPITINISDAALIEIPLDQVLANSEFTPLEFTPESALSESAMFIDCKTGYYLTDPYKKKAVSQFDLSGRFIRTIGKAGKGPGEYTGYTDALVTENGLEFLSPGSPSRVHKYSLDGKYIRTDQVLEQYAHSFAVNPRNGNYLLFCPYYQHLIQEVDKSSLQRVDSFLVRNTKIDLGGAKTFSTTTLGFAISYQPFDNRIFSIGKDSAEVRYRFDVGASTPDYDSFDFESQMKLLTDGIFWYIYKALENRDWLYLLVSKQDNQDSAQSQFYSLLYKKKSGKLYRLPDSPEPGPLFHPAFALGEDNILYTAVQPVNIYESDDWKSELTKRNIPVSPDGNLIVVKIPINKLVR